MPTQDKSQEIIREGDNVEGTYEDEVAYRYTGIVIAVDSNRILVERTDGHSGGGPNGEWICDLRYTNSNGSKEWGADESNGTLKKIGEPSITEENLLIRKTSSLPKERMSIDRYERAMKLTQISY